MRNLVCVFSCLCLYCTCLLSQRNAPIAGDAATLVDLLRKDYSVIDQSLLDDEIMKNRAQVISIFKSYLVDPLEIINTGKGQKIIDVFNKKQEAFTIAQKIYTTYTTVDLNTKTVDEIRAVQSNLNHWTNNLEKAKKELFEAKYQKDNFELQSLLGIYKENKYVSFIIEKFVVKYENLQNKKIDINAKSNQNASIQKSIPFLGGDVGFEMVIDGLSKFLAKRIKEELTTYVINEVKTWLKNPGQNDPIAELKVILPMTNDYLLNFNANQVTNFPTQIKQYIEDDFNNIFDNIANLKNTPRLQRLTEQFPDIDFALEAIEMIPNLSKIKNPVDYFELLENSRNLNRWKLNRSDEVRFNIANTLSLSTMLAHSFTFIENGQPRFVGTDFISTYGSEHEFYLLYVGFLYQQNVKYYKDLSFIKTSEIKISEHLNRIVNIGSISIETVKQDKDFFQKLFKDISKNAEKVLISSTEIKKLNKTGLKIGPDTLYNYINSIIDLAKEVTFSCDTLIKFLGNKLTPQITEIEIKEKITPYFRVASQMNEIVLDFQKKRYSTGLIKTLEITNDFISMSTNGDKKEISHTISELRLIDINYMDRKMNASDWKILNDILLLKNTENVLNLNLSTIDNKQKDALNRLVLKLSIVLDFYYDNYTINERMQYDIVFLSSIINKMKMDLEITPDEVSDANYILNKPSFQQIVLSSFLGYNISEELKNIRSRLIDLKIGEINIFSNSDLTYLESSLSVFHNSIFQYLIQSNEMTFTTAKNAFLNAIFELMLKMPKNTNNRNYERVTKLIHFINDMAVSKDSDEIAKAIENFALPAGSYAIKREAKLNVSINSFPGILLSGELTWKNNSSYLGFSPSFTAPIGLSITKSICNGKSSGIFIPIIDIGAFTRFYLGNADTTMPDAEISKFPSFSFRSIFSPGIYYHYGFKNSPISINGGVQYGPGLREINKGGEAKIHESIRFGVGLVLDIPLLNLHNKPKF